MSRGASISYYISPPLIRLAVFIFFTVWVECAALSLPIHWLNTTDYIYNNNQYLLKNSIYLVPVLNHLVCNVINTTKKLDKCFFLYKIINKEYNMFKKIKKYENKTLNMIVVYCLPRMYAKTWGPLAGSGTFVPGK